MRQSEGDEDGKERKDRVIWYIKEKILSCGVRLGLIPRKVGHVA